MNKRYRRVVAAGGPLARAKIEGNRGGAVKCDKYLSTLRQARSSAVTKAGSRGERVLGSLFPNRGVGWPGGWSQNRTEQVYHYLHWSYVAISLLCKKFASITPNMAYVVDAPKPGVTVKAGQRGLYNLMHPDRFRGSTEIGPGYDYGMKTVVNGSTYDYGQRWDGKGGYASRDYEGMSFSDGGHSWLTMGEYRSKALSVVKPHEELEPLESDHPLRRLIENPNPFDTQYDLAYEELMFRKLCGVSYVWLCPNDWGTPAEMWVIPSHWVWPRTGGGRYISPDYPHADELIQYYEIRPWGGMGSAGFLRFPPDEVVMTLYKSPINKIDGYSPLFAGARWQDLEESISQSRWSQMINQARPELVIELGPGYEDPTDDMISRIEAKFLSRIQGEVNVGKPFIMPPGAKATPISISPSEMAYFQSEEQVRDMLLSLHCVPPAAVGLVKDMTFGSILATLGSLCSFGLNPELVQQGQCRTKHLCSRFDESAPAYSSLSYGGRASKRKVRLWYDDCVPADPAQVNSDIQADSTSYAITPNEVRALRGRKPYKLGGDNPIVTGPGGPMPLLINVDEDLSGIAEGIAQLSAAEGKMTGESAQAAGMENAPEEALGQSPIRNGAANGKPAGQANAQGRGGAAQGGENLPETDLAEDAGPPENPNGKPSKSVRKGPIQWHEDRYSFTADVGGHKLVILKPDTGGDSYRGRLDGYAVGGGFTLDLAKREVEGALAMALAQEPKPSKALTLLAAEFLGERHKKSLTERLREKMVGAPERNGELAHV